MIHELGLQRLPGFLVVQLLESRHKPVKKSLLDEEIRRVYKFSENFYAVLIGRQVQHQTDKKEIIRTVNLLQRNHNTFDLFNAHRLYFICTSLEIVHRTSFSIHPNFDQQIFNIALKFLPIFFNLHTFIMDKLFQVLIIMGA